MNLPRCRLCFAWLLCAVALLGCGENLTELLRSEHFVISAEKPVEPYRYACDGLTDWLEHHYEVIARFLDIEQRRTIEIVVSDGDGVRARCGGATGCWVDGKVHATHALNAHELAHAYTAQVGEPPLLFIEGIAGILCGARAMGQPIRKEPGIVDFMSTAAMRALSLHERLALYGPAAGFVRFLLDRYGRDRLLAFYRATPHDANSQQIRSHFSDAFEASLDQGIAAWIAGPEQTGAGICLALAECASAPLPADGPPAERRLSCHQSANQRPALIRTIDLPDRAFGSFRGQSTAQEARLELNGCGFEPAVWARVSLGVPLLGHNPGELWVDLDPGKYWVAVSGDPGAKADGELVQLAAEISPSPPLKLPEKGAITVSRDPAACPAETCMHELVLQSSRPRELSLSAGRLRRPASDALDCRALPVELSICAADGSGCSAADLSCEMPTAADLTYALQADVLYRLRWVQAGGRPGYFQIFFAD